MAFSSYAASLNNSCLPIQAGITCIRLTDFRSYEALKLDCDLRPVVLTGKNGMGKTNLLEALSFLSPGKGLRSQKLSQISRFGPLGSQKAWYVNVEVRKDSEKTIIGTGYEKDLSHKSEKRLIKINGEKVRSQTDLSPYLNVNWLTPQMDGLFQGSSSERRRFLDRLIYTFDSDHASRVYRYDYALRERSRLLRQGVKDPHWFYAVEETMVSSGIAIAYARQEAVRLLSQASSWALGVFPQAEIKLEGPVDTWIEEGLPALSVEEKLQTSLRSSRSLDAERGGAQTGPHRTDMSVTYPEKGMLASQCSTGEQKALLLSLIMASIRVQSTHHSGASIVLLDEVVAHLDDGRRRTLYEEIKNLKMQVWMTGTDYNMFAALQDDAQYFMVENSFIKPQDR